MAYGLCLKEVDIKTEIKSYLEKLSPDIVVITGHDAYYKRKGSTDNVMNYKNTSNFIDAVKVARNYEKNQDKLIIIAPSILESSILKVIYNISICIHSSCSIFFPMSGSSNTFISGNV